MFNKKNVVYDEGIESIPLSIIDTTEVPKQNNLQ